MSSIYICYASCFQLFFTTRRVSHFCQAPTGPASGLDSLHDGQPQGKGLDIQLLRVGH